MSTPKHSVLIALAVFCIAPAAQSDTRWSTEQKEVWQAVKTCTDYFHKKDLEKARSCVHEDFKGWLYAEPVPRSKDYFKSIVPYFVETRTIHAADLRPIEIVVHNETAVVHYSYIEISTDKQSNETIEQGRWTDVLVKDGGRWVWIADHGGPRSD